MSRAGVKGYAARARGRAPRRWMTPTVRSKIFDWCVVVLAMLIEIADMTSRADHAHRHENLPLFAISLLGPLILIVRRTRPVQVLLVAVALDVLPYALDHELFDLMSVATLGALYACGRYRPVRTGWLTYGVVLGIEGVASLLFPTANVLSGLILAALTVALGQYLRLRSELAQRHRVEAAEVAVRAERRRIARELHDVVAHHISVMSVLVGAARTTMAIDPVRAEEALAITEQTAREALAEMRQLLAVLRADDSDEPEPAAGARAAHVPELVEAVRSAGVAVGLEVTGPPRELPAAVDLAVYRIIQEALTNVRKHAPGAAVQVRVCYEVAAIDVAVVDDGAGPGPGPAPPASGYGLGGMAERVALCGGRLDAGPRPEGGFLVHARIPVPVIGEGITESDYAR